MACTPSYHDTTHSPLALWQFSGSIQDSSGNGWHLRLATGTERYTELVPGFKGFFFDGSTRLSLTASMTPFYTTGSLTIEMLCIPSILTAGTNDYIISHDSGTNDTANSQNFIYAVAMGPANSISYFAERNTGVDIRFDPTSSLNIGTLYHIAMVRDSNSRIGMFINGSIILESGTHAPTDGTSGTLNIGDLLNNAQGFTGAVASIKLIKSALTHEEIRQEYLRTLGGCCCD